MKKLENFKKRYMAKSDEYPDGIIIHNWVCTIYSVGICDCGLFFDIMRLIAYSEISEEIKSLCSHIDNYEIIHYKQMDKLRELDNFVKNVNDFKSETDRLKKSNIFIKEINDIENRKELTEEEVMEIWYDLHEKFPQKENEE